MSRTWMAARRPCCCRSIRIASAARIHRQLKKRTGLHVPVIIADSFGRAWREGLCEVAIGVAGMQVMHDYRGQRDDYGYKMHATEEAVADELACVAGLVCGKRFARSGLYNPGLRVSRGKRQRRAAGASGGEGFVSVGTIPEQDVKADPSSP